MVIPLVQKLSLMAIGTPSSSLGLPKNFNKSKLLNFSRTLIYLYFLIYVILPFENISADFIDCARLSSSVTLT